MTETELVKVRLVRSIGDPVVCNLNPRTTLSVSLLNKGSSATDPVAEAKAVDAVTVMLFVFADVMFGEVVDTAMVDVPMLVNLNPELVKSATPLEKLPSAFEKLMRATTI